MADYEYKFIMDISTPDGGIHEIRTSIRRMNPDLIKGVLEWQSHDFMGRTPEAKLAKQKLAERNRKKAEKLRMKKAQKVVF
ncbi:MAG: hypothetical protein R2877_01325 [Bdellovibrionota bacterium]